MRSLEECLKEAVKNNARHKVIATDGVFSMDGTYAKLDEICLLAKQYDALVMVDDCHATGFVGEKGKGTPEHFGVEGKIDILTGTLGKHWVAHLEVLFAQKKMSLSCSNKNQDLIFSQMLWRPQ